MRRHAHPSKDYSSSSKVVGSFPLDWTTRIRDIRYSIVGFRVAKRDSAPVHSLHMHLDVPTSTSHISWIRTPKEKIPYVTR